MYRRRNDTLEVLLDHPGGPYFQKKDDGFWTIPKGEDKPDEDLLSRARTEFEEEVGIPANGNWIDLGRLKQKDSKIDYAWAFEGDLPGDFQACANNSDMDGPPRTKTMQSVAEVDRASCLA